MTKDWKDFEVTKTTVESKSRELKGTWDLTEIITIEQHRYGKKKRTLWQRLRDRLFPGKERKC